MNTPSKRASAIGIGLALRLILPVPDAAISQGDRQQVAYSYAGILAGALVPPSEVIGLTAAITEAGQTSTIRRIGLNACPTEIGKKATIT